MRSGLTVHVQLLQDERRSLTNQIGECGGSISTNSSSDQSALAHDL
jgi:hypothetical protein